MESDVLQGLNITGRVPAPKRFIRHIDRDHRVLEADDAFYCGDFMCHGQCGKAKLIRVMPGGDSLERDIVQQATALLGVESLWSNYRWMHSQPWDGPVVVAEYDESNPVWW
jgi:hypothetical protein